METIPDTWVVAPKRPDIPLGRQAYLVHIYPTVPGMGSRHTLGEATVVIGRGAGCDICIADQSISRQHVRIQAGMDGHYAVDLESTNGTFVNDAPATMSKLKDGDYLRIGNWIFRYLAGGNVEAEYHEEIYRLTIIDALTGVHNKRYLLDFLDRELARSARHHRPLALVMIDIDRFKEVNDQLGHLGGDHTLRELVSCIRKAIRKEELFARYGGEEFAVVLPETTVAGAMTMAERLRHAVETLVLQYDDKPFQVTISLGVAGTDGTEVLTPDDLIRLADEKLFEAKKAGRNCMAGQTSQP